MATTISTQAVSDPRAIARVDLDAVTGNCGTLKRELGHAELCAVIKADGYGHGALACARAALDGGAGWLAVVTATEAATLRGDGIDGHLLVMGALTDKTLATALSADSDVVIWRNDQLESAARCARESGVPARVHVKLDTGMGRLGTADRDQAVTLANAAAADSATVLAGFMTHFATADEPRSDFFDEQLARFATVAEQIKSEHPDCVIHAANSAATFRAAAAHFDMARCGIAIYGLDPFGSDPSERGLAPALGLESYVADVKSVQAGESVGYGRSWRAERDTEIAVLPIGYGDGYRRGLSNRAHVLIAGRRFPVVGTISMDNTTVELGRDSGIAPGERVVLIGADGDERIMAEELARHLGTINYEVTCGLSQRVPRVHERAASSSRR